MHTSRDPMAHNAWVAVPEATQSCRVENLTSSREVVVHGGGRQKPADLKASLVDQRTFQTARATQTTDKTCLLQKPTKQTKLTSEALVPGSPPRPHYPF